MTADGLREPPATAEPHARREAASPAAGEASRLPPELTDRAAVEGRQAERLASLLRRVAESNAFYRDKFAAAGVDVSAVRGPADLPRLPFTTKAELAADQKSHPPYGRNLTFPPDRYIRLHQTSGTSDTPIRWLDTAENWAWHGDIWRVMLPAMGLVPGRDRLFFPFSFGPFLGFWAAFDSAQAMGFLVLSGGGMSSAARLRFLLEHRATAVFATPTYALRLAEVAAAEGVDLRSAGVRAVVVAGEPGGQIPETRRAIETAWGARVFDHTGMTEVGPTGFECVRRADAVHIVESEYIVEVLRPGSAEPVADGQVGELVLTNLGRVGSPLIRYRTGDLVRWVAWTPDGPGRCPCGRAFGRMMGGILGRADDMIHIRGNNLYPSALEAVLRRFPEVAEWRVEVYQAGPLSRLRLDIEPSETGADGDLPARVAAAIRERLSFTAEVSAVPPGTLPRFEMKARRVVRRTEAAS